MSGHGDLTINREAPNRPMRRLRSPRVLTLAMPLQCNGRRMSGTSRAWVSDGWRSEALGARRWSAAR